MKKVLLGLQHFVQGAISIGKGAQPAATPEDTQAGNTPFATDFFNSEHVQAIVHDLEQVIEDKVMGRDISGDLEKMKADIVASIMDELQLKVADWEKQMEEKLLSLIPKPAPAPAA